MKKIKYYLFCLLGYAPIIAGIVAILYIWFIRLPYKSTYYYVSHSVSCSKCEIELGSDEQFCPICSKSVADIAVVNTYKHCNFCESCELYKNSDTAFCKNCGKSLEPEHTIKLSEFGYSDVKSFRRALMIDNLKRLLNNNIMTSVLVIVIVIITRNFIYQAMLRAAKRKIIRDGLNRNNSLK